MPSNVYQPPINYSTTTIGGTFNVDTGDIIQELCSASSTISGTPSVITNGKYLQINFTPILIYCEATTDSSTVTTGDFFLVKNTSTTAGNVLIYHPTGGTINNIPVSISDYVSFSLASGKLLAVYVGTTVNKISVTYI
jgi:hypothetical protein